MMTAERFRTLLETRAEPFRKGLGYEFPGSVVNVLAR